VIVVLAGITKNLQVKITTYNEKENRIYCYRHLERFSNLKLNSLIKKGMLLGRIGLTGYVITPHLHFVIYEIDKKGKYLLKSIPIKFIQ